MKTYKYKAINKNGKVIQGKYALQNEMDLIYIMKDKGFFLLDYRICPLEKIKNFTYKVTYKERAIFCKQLFEIIKSGINLSKALELLAYQNHNPKISNSLILIKENVEKGMYLSESLGKFSKIYPEFMIGMIKIGEQSGNMEKVLFDLYEYYWKRHKAYTNIKSILTYPITVLVTAVVITIGILTKIVPSVVKNLTANNIQVSDEIEEIMKLNELIVSEGVKLLVIFILLVMLVLKKKGYIDRVANNIKLFAPGIRLFYQEIYEVEFSNKLSLLVSSGVSILSALDIIKDSSENPYHEEKINALSLNIREGMNFSKALEESGLFKKFFISMIEVGEESGNIDQMLHSISYIYEENLKSNLKKISSLIEPLSTIVIALVITFIIVKIMFPIIQLMDSIEVAF